MAAETAFSQTLNRIPELALRLRRPATRVCGSVRASVLCCAVLIGAYHLLIGTIYIDYPGWYRRLNGITMTGSIFSFASAIADIFLIFGFLIKRDLTLKYILCATMAIYMIHAPFSISIIMGFAIWGSVDIVCWEISRLGMGLLHINVMYCLLRELHDPELPSADSWLKNNISQQSPKALIGSDPLLKLQVNEPPVFAPSSCTTAVPVHANTANCPPARVTETGGNI